VLSARHCCNRKHTLLCVHGGKQRLYAVKPADALYVGREQGDYPVRMDECAGQERVTTLPGQVKDHRIRQLCASFHKILRRIVRFQAKLI
jgi:hypothetical protein